MELSIDELYEIVLIITKHIMDNEEEMQRYRDSKELTESYSKRIKEATDLKNKVFDIYIERKIASRM